MFALNSAPVRSLAHGHAAYLLFGGLWPLLHMSSFVAVTGPKSDLWLVRTVAGLLVVIGGTLLREARAGHVLRGTSSIAAGTSLVLGLVSIVSAASGRIWPIYFLDGMLHLVFTLAWAAAFLRLERERPGA